MNSQTLAVTLLSCTSLTNAGPFDAKDPTFEIQVSSMEIEPMRFAAAYGISRYGGDVSFETRIARVPDASASPQSFHDVTFTLVLKGQRTIDAWAFWCAEQTTQFLSGVNLDQLDERSKSSLKALQTLNVKLTQAKLNPQWESVTVPAVVATRLVQARPGDAASATPAASVFTLSAGGQWVEAQGPATGTLKDLVGKRALVKGVVKTPGVIELASAQPIKEHTLELVVMSQCPFGSKAADAIIEYLKSPAAKGSNGTPPTLDVRYLFYERKNGAGEQSKSGRWWSMHGEAEVAENLVQMAIRDQFAAKFRDYLQARARQPAAAWRDIAAQVGLPAADADFIAAYIESNGETMIASEHEYVLRTLGVSDGSPTFVWESQTVGNIAGVPEFAALDLNHGSCANTVHP